LATGYVQTDDFRGCRGNVRDKMDKISIRFFNDTEVRAVWDEENSKWWFSVLDIIGVLNEWITATAYIVPPC